MTIANMLIDTVHTSMTLADINRVVLDLIMDDPRIASVEFTLVGGELIPSINIAKHVKFDVYEFEHLWPLLDKLATVTELVQYVDQRGRYVSGPKGTIGFLVSFMRDLLTYHGVRKVYVSRAEDGELGFVYGPSSSGKPNPGGEKAVSTFLRAYVARYPDLDYASLASYNERNKTISFGVARQS